jgi:hypothetical protein
MSVRTEVRHRVVEIIAVALPDVQVLGRPPAENQALREAVWVQKVTSRFEWRGMGGPAAYQSNRKELLQVDLRADAYREAQSQLDAGEDAVARSEELLELIEAAIAADPTLGIGCAVAKVTVTGVEPQPKDAGWVALGICRIDVENYPAIT